MRFSELIDAIANAHIWCYYQERVNIINMPLLDNACVFLILHSQENIVNAVLNFILC